MDETQLVAGNSDEAYVDDGDDHDYDDGDDDDDDDLDINSEG